MFEKYEHQGLALEAEMQRKLSQGQKSKPKTNTDIHATKAEESGKKQAGGAADKKDKSFL